MKKGYIKYQLEISRLKPRQKPAISKSVEQYLAEMPTAAAVVLAVIAAAGLTTAAIIFPGSMQILRLFMHRQHGRRPTNKEVEDKFIQTVYYLKKTGRIQFEQNKESLWVRLGKLTKKDKVVLDIGSTYISKPSSWDNTYWLVAADIPTKTHRSEADAFRTKLVSMGFYPLQRTLWLYPYDPLKELQAIANYFQISHYVTLMHVDKLDMQDKDDAIAFWKRRGIL